MYATADRAVTTSLERTRQKRRLPITEIVNVRRVAARTVALRDTYVKHELPAGESDNGGTRSHVRTRELERTHSAPNAIRTLQHRVHTMSCRVCA